MQLTDLVFTNRFMRGLPADPVEGGSVRRVERASYSRVQPTPVSAPALMAWSPEAGALIGLRPDPDPAELAAVLSGNRLLPGMDPVAACYGGHQFGHWAGQLGDGRAIVLGEVPGAEPGFWELQLKGAGPTPYSRHADGRAVLRSSVREFVCSEAMHHLGIPTTRALALVATGESVVRDMFYDGRPEAEPGAIVTRMAPSFLRFGNLELPAARRDVDLLRRTFEFLVRHYYPELVPGPRDAEGLPTGPIGPEQVLAFFRVICERTLRLVVDWMRVGFVHGVMNTDNMSALGLTIDYGPYGWLDSYDPVFTPNTSDTQRRYCYANQPHCAVWNLACLANALVPLVGGTDALTAELHECQPRFERWHAAMWRHKLGWEGDVMDPSDQRAEDELVVELQDCLQLVETDLTLFFRGLADRLQAESADAAAAVPDAASGWLSESALYAPLRPAQRERWQAWIAAWRARSRQRGLAAPIQAARMNAVNPAFVPRNYLVHQAIESLSQGDSGLLQRLMMALKTPYQAPREADLTAPRPDWARQTPGCSALSCSS